MKKIYVLSAAAVAAMTVLSGCSSPQLAATPIPPKEEAWIMAMKEAYPSWQPPKLAPPHMQIPDNELVGAYPGQPDVISPMETTNNLNPPVIKEEIFMTPDLPLPPPLPPVIETPKTVVNPISKPAPIIKPVVKSALTIKNPSLVKDGKYTVVSGDSFWVIAIKVYGNGAHFQRIQDANPNVTSSRIRPGLKINIPGTAAETAPAPAPTVVPVPAPATVIPALPLTPATPGPIPTPDTVIVP